MKCNYIWIKLHLIQDQHLVIEYNLPILINYLQTKQMLLYYFTIEFQMLLFSNSTWNLQNVYFVY